MKLQDAQMIRHLAQSSLGNMKIYYCLKKGLSADHDEEEVLEHLAAYEKLLAFIFNHGLEATDGAAWQRGFQHGYQEGHDQAVSELMQAIDEYTKEKLDEPRG